MRMDCCLRSLVSVIVLSTWACLAGCGGEKPATAPKGGDAADKAAAGKAASAPDSAATGKTAAAKLPKVPLGLPEVSIPKDNPMTAEKVELGRQLYFDKRLSKDGTVSCATCHDPKMAYAEHEPVSTGIGAQKGGRNSPSVINSAYATSQFWDGRAKTLEEQALGPIANPIEMGHDLEAMIGDLSKLQGYTEQFQKVFGTPPTTEGVAKAIAAFERTILSGNSPYDRYTEGGDKTALDASQQRGLKIFEDDCATCHTPPIFSGFRFFNAGIGMDKEKPDLGRMDVTKDEADKGKFRTPALREVANTAPYFHDGSAKTLEEAVGIMAKGGIDNANLSAGFKGLRGETPSDQDIADLVAFLKALSGEYPVVDPPKLP